MKKLFGKDKPKTARVSPAQIASGRAVLYEDRPPYLDRPHLQQCDSAQLQQRMPAQQSTDERWKVVSSHNDDNSNITPNYRYGNWDRGISDLGSPRPPALVPDSRSSSLIPGPRPWRLYHRVPLHQLRTPIPAQVAVQHSTAATHVPETQGRARGEATGGALRKRPQAAPGNGGSAPNAG
ncbi:hypothetical protein FIBSPDRAFT_1054940 [Athelia psychrophila]|uniref:Uncharacterized protein n=1 Tax=Athelia psychrophila TaxID=1759441 RepID=A0A167UKG4_9AGAM|nr:hypothetical protein FIBSPDRAFT_1054940 [Fibularhizoctonia sp. CBS 109695]